MNTLPSNWGPLCAPKMSTQGRGGGGWRGGGTRHTDGVGAGRDNGTQNGTEEREEKQKLKKNPQMSLDTKNQKQCLNSWGTDIFLLTFFSLFSDPAETCAAVSSARLSFCFFSFPFFFFFFLSSDFLSPSWLTSTYQ